MERNLIYPSSSMQGETTIRQLMRTIRLTSKPIAFIIIMIMLALSWPVSGYAQTGFNVDIDLFPDGDVYLGYAGEPFDLIISEAKQNNIELNGFYNVTVESIDGGPLGGDPVIIEGILFNNQLEFIDGNASISINIMRGGLFILKIDIQGLGEKVLPYIYLLDLSEISASLSSDPIIQGVEFNLVMGYVYDVYGDPIYNVSITIDNENDGRIYSNSNLQLNEYGDTDIPLILSTSGAQTLTITVVGVPQPSVLDVFVEESLAGFDLSFRDPLTAPPLLPISELIAGTPLIIRLSNATGNNGILLNGNYPVGVVSNLLQNPVFLGSLNFNQGTANINLSGANAITLAGDHNITATITSIGASKTTALKVKPDLVNRFVLTQQPTGGSGTFGFSPAAVGNISLISVDKYGNISGGLDLSSTPGAINFTTVISQFIPDPLGRQAPAGVLGGTVAKSITGLTNQNSLPLTLSFDNLTLNRNGNFTLSVQFTSGQMSSLEDPGSVTTSQFTMSNMEPLSSFTIVDPGPKLVGESFNLQITDVKGNTGIQVPNGPRGVTVDYIPATPGAFTGPLQFEFTGGNAISFTNGQGQIPLTAPQLVSPAPESMNYHIRVTIDGLWYPDSLLTPVFADDQSGFTLAAIGNQIQGNLFNVAISEARNVGGTLLSGSHTVTVTSEFEGVRFSGPLTFTAGAATGQIALFQKGTQQVTVAIAGINTPQATQVTVTRAMNLTYSGQPINNGTLTIPSAAAGYSGISATVTIQNAGAAGLSGIAITLAGGVNSQFEVVPGYGTSIAGLGTGTFGIRPKTGLMPGTYTETVTVTATVNGGQVSESFVVSFTVTDIFGIAFSAQVPLNPLNLGSPEFGYPPVTPVTVTISNTGTAVITGINLSLSGNSPSAFILNTTNPETASSLQPGGTTTFTIRPINGLQPELYLATVTATSDNAASASFNVRFRVRDAYVISLSQQELLDFGAEIFGYQPINITQITISNVGTDYISGLSVGISGASASSFVKTDPAFIGLDAGASTTFTVKPKDGLPVGFYTATVTVSFTEGSPKGFDVQFRVLDPGLSIELDPSTNQFIGIHSAGYNPVNARIMLVVENNGTTSLTSLEVSSSNNGFIENVTLSGFSKGSSDTLQYYVTPIAGLASGFYTTTLTFKPNGTSESIRHKTIGVSFLVDDHLWTGNTSTSWNIASNWGPATYTGGGVFPATIPNEFVRVIIPDVAIDPVITGSLTHRGAIDIASGGALFIGNNGHLTLENTGTLNVNGRLEVSATGRLTSNGLVNNSSSNIDNFIVRSNAASTGSVILSNSGVYATVERWMEGGGNLHLVSPPVSGQDKTQFLQNNAIQFNGSIYAIREFNEFNNTWRNWGVYSGGSFQTGQSYILIRNGAGVVSFKGEIRNSAGTTLARTGSRWNAIGNPFASSMRKNEFLSAVLGSLELGFEALYLYDYSLGSGSRYVPVNLLSGLDAIAPGQGFFVKANPDAGASMGVSFESSMRTHNNGAVFLKSGGEVDKSIKWQRVNLQAYRTGGSASTLLAFHPAMSKGLDRGYDASVYSVDPAFSIYTRMPDGAGNFNLAIQALPSDGDRAISIPVGFRQNTNGEVTFTVSAVGLPASVTPILYDAVKDIYTEMVFNTYKTTVTSGEPQTSRFFMVMQDNSRSHKVSFASTGEGGSLYAETNDALISSGSFVAEGDAVVFVAAPLPGYEVSAWRVNGVLRENNKSEMLVVKKVLGPVDVAVEYVNTEKENLPLFSGNVFEKEWRVFYHDGYVVVRGLVEENTTLYFTDITGRMMPGRLLQPGLLNRVSTAGLREGVYIVRITGNGRTETRRVYIK